MAAHMVTATRTIHTRQDLVSALEVDTAMASMAGTAMVLVADFMEEGDVGNGQ
jgi:hypothetical protein